MNRIAATIDRGELGRPMGYTLRDDQYWPTGDVVPGHSSWRSQRSEAGGGALLEHSIHSADIVSWLFGPAVRVYARSRNLFGYDVEDVAALTVEHQSGVVGTILTVFNGVRGREERRFEVFFERGAVEATTDFLVGAPEDSYLVQQPDTEARRPDLAALRHEHFTALGLPRRDFVFYTYPADRHFVQAVQAAPGAGVGPGGGVSPGPPVVPGFHDALVAHRLVEAAYRSAAGQGAVAIDDDFI
jgi:predicted dehydrogenase